MCTAGAFIIQIFIAGFTIKAAVGYISAVYLNIFISHNNSSGTLTQYESAIKQKPFYVNQYFGLE